MRLPASPPSFPRFTSLPFAPQLRSTATIGQPTSSPRPINVGLSPPCYWVEQNKNKHSEKRQSLAEAARRLRRVGLGRWTRDLGERRRRRPEGSVPAARLARPGGPRPLPQPRSLSGGSRTMGGGGSVEAAAPSGQVRVGGAGVRPPPPSPAALAAPAPTPRAAENRPRFPPSRPGPRARRRGPASSGTPAPLGRARGALLGEGVPLVPAKARLSFFLGGVGRRAAGLTQIW